MNTENEIKTEQQEVAYKEYLRQVSDENLELNFWDWYRHWCYENNLFNDEKESGK